ncbi:hypothetical protein TUM4438_45210 [Shewanella sairae]|uniref:TetR family transcriptional regulator n=1 Tax=Shewanella sairae TaxID=190310 RepID=A0ABQ4PRR3_9GAMM|nr:hypothetical protein [Shewanella sairae]MCL1132642.1 hypothetical protein [Shewanella sairae]GIU52448.1 hypothetical protein TUM4438_45210 [Shewanella sairae]
MLRSLFKNENKKLAEECHQYLIDGPPASMTDYMPESLTEIIIAHGAQNQKLNDELIEVASIILMELSGFSDIDDFATRQYMEKGASLVERVFQNQ